MDHNDFRTLPICRAGSPAGKFYVLDGKGRISGKPDDIEETCLWMTLEEAFQSTGLFPHQVAAWIRDRSIRSWKHGKTIRVPVIVTTDGAAYVIPTAAYDAVRYVPVKVMRQRLKRHAELHSANEIVFPERYEEGAKKQVVVNAYERNERAREECLAHYGNKCAVCGHSMKALYGDIGVEIIHVHHLRELSSIGKAYRVNPIRDLRPVCPNCHAVLHSCRPAVTIAELRKRLEARRRKKPVRF